MTLSPHSVSISLLVQTYVTPDRISDDLKIPLALFLVEATSTSSGLDQTFPDLCLSLREIHEDAEELVVELRDRLDGIESPDDLFDLFTELELLLDGNIPAGDDQLESNSPLGLFIRRIVVAFHSSMFHGLSRLFSELNDYKMLGHQFPIDASQTQLDAVITKRAVDLEYAREKPSPKEDQILSRPLVQLPPRASYLRYLTSVEEGDFEGAVDAVHRYFDYSFHSAAGNGVQNVGGTVQNSSVQWGLLNLAGLHFRFGHIQEALQAVLETVKIAQQINDHVCLAHAISWLYRLVGRGGDVGTHRRLISRAIARSKELDLPHLQGSAMLSLANHHLVYARRAAGVFGNADTGPMVTQPRQFWMQSLQSTLVDKANTSGDAEVLRSVGWSFFGHSPLAMLAASRCLEMTDHDATAENICIALCKSAIMSNSGAESEECIADLVRAAPHLPPALWKHCARAILQLRFSTSLIRGEVGKLGLVARAMLALCPKGEGGEAEQFVEACIAKVQYLLALCDYTNAAEEAHQAMIFCENNSLPLPSIHLLALLATVHVECGSLASALGIALSCLSLCEQHNLDHLKNMVFLVMARIHLEMHAPHKALPLLNECLPQLLVHGSLFERGEAYLLIARVHLAATPIDEQSLFFALDKARLHFEAVSAPEKLMHTYYLSAMAHAMTGNEAGREAAATEFLNASQALEEARQRTGDSDIYALLSPARS